MGATPVASPIITKDGEVMSDVASLSARLDLLEAEGADRTS
jgi:hypothetical protein